MALVGAEVKEFRASHLKSEPPKSISKLLETLTPPEGVIRKGSDEGYELYD